MYFDKLRVEFYQKKYGVCMEYCKDMDIYRVKTIYMPKGISGAWVDYEHVVFSDESSALAEYYLRLAKSYGAFVQKLEGGVKIGQG